ncbi:class I SAM-dependent methyltransferase [Actinomycetospora rhizophila]|uniref:Class I SAM-dependent methyltransferase n=1 Tax=Actinomycetospora rhizophila TaxID=1416876 RepID=A0ABV9ZHL8_9PSEU
MRGDLTDTYASNAEFWVRIIREQLDRYRTDLTDAAVLAALGDVNGARVLDGGCGEGYMGRLLAERGAQVTGIDTSAALIDAAREHSDAERHGISYAVASLEAIPEPDGSFDAAVCNHVISDVADPAAALKELGRVLRPGGRLVLLMLHPCFYTAHAERDATGTIPVTTYFSERHVDQTFKVAGIESPDEVHMRFRPLEFYTRCITDAGFVITRLEEPHPSGDLLRTDWWRKNFVKPLFMLVAAEIPDIR